MRLGPIGPVEIVSEGVDLTGVGRSCRVGILVHELAVSGKAGIVPIIDVIALDLIAALIGVLAGAAGLEAKVRAFLERPHPMLDDKAPLEVALATGPGADAVLNLMGRAAYSGGVRAFRRPTES